MIICVPSCVCETHSVLMHCITLLYNIIRNSEQFSGQVQIATQEKIFPSVADGRSISIQDLSLKSAHCGFT
jgi:hypothetical protein